MKNIYSLHTYDKDNRMPIKFIYDSYSELDKKYWIKTILKVKNIKYNNKEYSYFIPAYKTKKTGKAIWLIAGIHGEEPAGANAIAKEIDYINKLGKKQAMVLLPICNPLGYIKNWRYPYSEKIYRNKISKSVGDSEHLLIDIKDTRIPRIKKPILKESELISKYVLKQIKKHPPKLVIDLHEDKSFSDSYIYSQGFLKHKDPVAKEIVKILIKRKFNIKKTGQTQFNQKIINGIVTNVKDGSIDELLSSYRIIINNKIKKGPRAKSVIVVETNVRNQTLYKRINAHSEIILNLERFFKMIKKIKTDL